MGIENRDYYREVPSDAGEDFLLGGGAVPACKWLIIATVLVFLCQIFLTRPWGPADFAPMFEGREKALDQLSPDEFRLLGLGRPAPSLVEDWLVLDANKVLRQGQVWRVLTHAFCHDRSFPWRLVVNMLFLYWFGAALERMLGSREFLLFYLSAVGVTGATYLILDYSNPGSGVAWGATGAVLGTAVLYALHHPHDTVRVFWVQPVDVRALIFIYVVLDLLPLLTTLGRLQPAYAMGGALANAAHLGGFAFGLLYWRGDWRLESIGVRLFGGGTQASQPRSGSKQSRRTQPAKTRPAVSTQTSKGNLSDELDRILEKLHAEGEDSLTDVERETLSQASQHFRRRGDG
ncbi:MAG: rhomboid family intramembrane serine protease [Planctomycetales bacterium]